MRSPTPPARPAHPRGRTRWPRFSVVLGSSLTTTALLAAASVTGAIPVQLAAVHRHPLKLSVDSFSAASIVPSTGGFETRDGQRRTELIFHLRDLTVRGLCLSNRVRTPVGSYTLRITSPTLTADRLTLALDSIDSLGLLSQQLRTGELINLLPLQDPPLGSSDDPGFLSLRVGAALAAVTVTLRYLSGSHLDVGKVRLVSGRAKQECF
ncbi:MAG TPA: DUF6230 family protein [Pseudonocardia sp.]|nr:DUF6230 family protein [Pseudonocardia sp.]